MADVKPGDEVRVPAHDPALLAPARTPCGTCPYRRDVPSGIWAAEEYAKLPAYDGDVPEQAAAGAFGLFMCHQRDGHLCAGWVGCHDISHNLAVRAHADEVDLDAVLGYESPVPLFASGAEAAEHGAREIAHPGQLAQRKARGLVRARSRQQED
jgi:hypothetical protein